MRFSDIRILYKVLTVVGLMAAIMAVISVISVNGLKELTEDTQLVEQASGEALTGARVNQNVIALNRAEFRAAADPSPGQLTEVETVVREQRQQLEERLTQLKGSADGRQMDLLRGVDAAYADYLKELADTLAVAKRNGAQITNDKARQEIVDSALASRAAATKLQEAMRAYNQYSDKKAETTVQAADDHAREIQALVIAVAVAGILGGIAVGYLIAQFGIGRPVAASVDSLKRLADGDTTVAIHGLERKDEIGAIAGTMQVFKENLIRNHRMEEEAKLAEQRAAEEKKRTMNQLADRFESSVKGVVGAVSSSATQLQGNAQSMSSVAEETTRQASAVAAATEQASANVQTVAAAAEELAGSIAEIARQVEESARITQTAVEEAERTNTMVEGLADAAQKIGTVVQLINDIAGQTNLLALNATIEAARAGEAGKGFAVVASEVKSLANQTAKATEDISSQVMAIQKETMDAVGAIRSIAETVQKVNQIATGIASAVEEQTAATGEISRNVQQAAVGTTEVTRNISGVNQAALEAGGAANEVLRAASDLTTQSATLARQVDDFIRTIRAA
ncbi:methyl-accepting chemotaxis protein [Azospirillum sp.]|uniref:methyl-accepting chemotaxis protein n=1 Tax=Azospirillum sp. TaxID=34012 RepID=UPI002D2F089C|nr:methyl-accepting chemotaxis protein [Azospirillum sp.]HYD68209.1 methyl-accepting chemotaxis protein [Azospirillum sp.]